MIKTTTCNLLFYLNILYCISNQWIGHNVLSLHVIFYIQI